MLRRYETRSWIPVAGASLPVLDWVARRRAERLPRYWQIGFTAGPLPPPAWRIRGSGRG